MMNDILWGISNCLFLYISISIPAFVIFYGGFFKWWQRPAGISVFIDRVSFVAVLSLVFIGVFVDPQQGFWEAPPDVLWWRPLYRVAVYGLVAFATTFQFVVALRRWLHTRPLEIEVDPRTRPRDRRPVGRGRK
jgi:hypothetical protein